jgi:hypothetical protein
MAGLAILATVVTVPFLYHHVSQLAFNPDPFTYLQQAKEVLEGKKLYTEVQFDKGPITILIYAIPEIFFPRSYPAANAFLGICLSLQSLAFVWVFRRDFTIGVACTLAITLIPLTNSEFSWLGTEHASNIFVTGAIIIAICIWQKGRFSPWQCLLAGVFSFLAMNVRQTAITVAIVPAIAILFTPKSLSSKAKGAAWCVGGGVLGLVSVLLGAWLISDIPAYLRKFYLHPATYAGLGTWTDTWNLLLEVFTTPLGWIGGAVILLAIAKARAWISATPLLMSAIAAGLLAVAMPHRNYSHYWMGVIPYLAMVIGIELFELRAKRRSVGLAASAFILCLTIVNIGVMYSWTTDHRDWDSRREIAEKADKIAPPNSTLLVWGPMGSEAIVFASEQPEANPNWILWMMEPPRDKLLPISVDELDDEYLENPPKEVAAYSDWIAALKDGAKNDPEHEPEMKLGKLLFKKYEYRFEKPLNNYSIGVLVGPAKVTTQNSLP